MDAITILIQENGRACVVRAGANVSDKISFAEITLHRDEHGDLRAFSVRQDDLVPTVPLSAPPVPGPPSAFMAEAPEGLDD